MEEGNIHMMGDGRADRDVLSTRGMERRKSRVTFASVVGSGNWRASLIGTKCTVRARLMGALALLGWCWSCATFPLALSEMAALMSHDLYVTLVTAP